MLPPKPSAKRDIGVNIRFNTAEYERLKRIAEYRGISVTTLLHYVIANGVLPRLEREMRKEQEHERRSVPNLPQAETTTMAADWLQASLDGSAS